MASVKNFQLIHPEEPERVVLQFGRVGKDKFTMDFMWPMTPAQGMLEECFMREEKKVEQKSKQLFLFFSDFFFFSFSFFSFSFFSFFSFFPFFSLSFWSLFIKF